MRHMFLLEMTHQAYTIDESIARHEHLLTFLLLFAFNREW
jgi:hypothetical protein